MRAKYRNEEKVWGAPSYAYIAHFIEETAEAN